MEIGARIAAWFGGKKLPYVTDGLVAMWDVELGLDGLVLKDLVGSCDLTASSNPTISGKFIDDTTTFMRQISDTEAKSVLDVAESGVYTLEFVSRIDLVGGCIFSARSSVGQMSCVSLADGRFIGTSHGGLLAKQPKTSSFSIFEKNAFMVNGVRIAASGTTANPFSTIGLVQIGGHSGTANVRVYNRQLTADEVLANYAIDKARFGLT